MYSLTHILETLPQIFRSASAEFLQEQISTQETYQKGNWAMFGDVSGVVSFTGEVEGSIAVSLPSRLALAITKPGGEDASGAASRSEVYGSTARLTVALGEAVRDGLGLDLHFAVPVIVTGRGHEIYHRQDLRCTTTIFETARKIPFSVDVTLPESFLADK